MRIALKVWSIVSLAMCGLALFGDGVDNVMLLGLVIMGGPPVLALIYLSQEKKEPKV